MCVYVHAPCLYVATKRAQRQCEGHCSPEVEESRSGIEETQIEDSAGILLRTTDCEDKQPRLEGLEVEGMQLGDPVTGDWEVEEDDGDTVFGVRVQGLSPDDVA